MSWTHFTEAFNALALGLNVLSLVLLACHVMAGFYFSLGINVLVVPFDYVRLGWWLLCEEATQRPPGWLLLGLTVAALVFAGKLVIDAVMVLLWLAWKDIPAGDR